MRAPARSASLALLVAATFLLVGCGNFASSSGPSSDASAVGDGPDPASLVALPGVLQLISMNNRNTCLRPQQGAVAQPGDAVGTTTCSGDAADGWRLMPDGTVTFAQSLCLTAADGGALTLSACSTGAKNQIWTLAAGRLMTRSREGTQVAVTASSAAIMPKPPFAAAQVAPVVATASLNQLWQVGLARPGPSGDSNVAVSGLAIKLAAADGACLTGRGVNVGLTACNGSASQAWIINEAGGLQLGAYCLAAITPGTISQGTPAQFALCRSEDLGQQWRVEQGTIALQDLALAPVVMPPPLAGFTETALSTSAAVWLFGG